MIKVERHRFLEPTFAPQIGEYGNFSIRKLIFTRRPGLSENYSFCFTKKVEIGNEIQNF